MASSIPPRPGEADNRGPSLVIINTSFTAIAAIFVALRIISRGLILKKPGLDDGMIVAATILAILNVVVAGLGVQYGTGKHMWDLEAKDANPAAKLRFITHIIYVLDSGLIKISISLLYLRLFPNIRRTTLSTIAFITSMTTAIFLATIFQCSPVDAVYDPQKYRHYSCFDSVPFWSSTAALYLATDIWVLLLPMKTILGLQASRRKRLVLTGLLSLGAFACIASIVRMVYIVKLYQGSDQSWHSVDVSIWSGVELALGIVAASIPSLRPILNQISPRVFASSARRSEVQGLSGGSAGGRGRVKPAASVRGQHEDLSLVRLTRKEVAGDEDSAVSVEDARHLT
ncbi:uncharacterized protein BO97DRAFT_462222 [Aspergillus homomorphus CBS 101889]|uniref:Rhodopsin domain-containing protein n=1 Tax=Aspergillus homomorphus (strain CBS 101889) TaxID=1450537 RepID=A0A395HKH3_ASPHC|nr:hypothetical protein BO97DRAFT_462222 [Aspergillus homomorphus CBS 101889]RAL07923.1 hypothetical protein BO97DRAFT_462222 [Aspergillus homomorphus CBS 101889]